MSALQPITLTESIPHLQQYLAGIVHLHAHCILHDGTLASFLPPLSQSKMLVYWQEALNQVTTNERHIIVLTLPISTRTATATATATAPDPTIDSCSTPAPVIPLDVPHEVVGVVSLYKPWAETGPFRAEVHKLFCSPNHRRKGIARALMKELERLARLDDRWSLILDTTVGTPAENVYPKLGYKRLGVIEAYGINPLDGRLVDEVWYWKDLRQSREL